MKPSIKRISLAKQLLLYSFLITFIVSLMISSLSFYLHTKEIKSELTDKVLDVSEIWSSILSVEDIETLLSSKDPSTPAFSRIKHSISLINSKDETFFHAAIVLPNQADRLLVTELVSTDLLVNQVDQILVNTSVDKNYISKLTEAVNTKQTTHSNVYNTKEGTWLTAFTPLLNRSGQVVAVFVLETDASVVYTSQEKTIERLFFIFLVASVIVYILLRFVIHMVLTPVNEIIRGLNEVSSGNFQVTLKDVDQSNLTPLFERFNYMTEQLALLFDRLSVPTTQMKAELEDHKIHTFELALGKMDHLIQETKLLKELQRAEKMNAIGQLAASVAHEIRNPMTVVKGFLQIFLTKESLQKEERTYVRLMLEEMNRAEKIINEYLALAKPDLELMEKVDAGELGYKVMDLIQSYALMSKSIVMDTSVTGDVYIKGNSSELKQVLINILKNGIEAMKDGGTLSLRIFKDGKFGVFEVLDTGIGMSEEELSRLGTAFYSLKEKGTGMGLVVCYQIVERMKGSISVKSGKGIGTVFKIKVPLYEEGDHTGA